MASVPLKPGYGPTLGELLAPRWRRAPRAVRGVTLAAGVGLVLAALAAVLTLEAAKVSYGGRTPFSFSYRHLYRTSPDPGGYVKVERRDSAGRLEDSFAVQRLRLPPYEGGLSGELPLYAAGYIRGLAARYEGFRLWAEGKGRVNTVPAYTVFYSALVDGQKMYGRDVLLLPERPAVRDGVDIVMLTSPRANATISSPLLVASEGVLETPLHTFTFE
jgi:hypothetical protein